MLRHLRNMLIVAAASSVAHWLWQQRPMSAPDWSDAEIAMLAALSIDSLPPPPADTSNAVADDPLAARFGHALFFDRRLSGNGGISCATCHIPELRFTDGRRKGQAIGTSKRNTPSIVGTAYSPWLYWDGRRDSLWAQAISPLEDPVEHGGNRMQYARFIADDADYRATYESLFSALPDFTDATRFPAAAKPGDPEWSAMAESDRVSVNRVFSNIGKAIAAYERLLMPGRSRFDDYVAALVAGDRERADTLLDSEEAQGLRLFIGEARCTECHNGPLFTNNEFHNTGVLSFPGDLPDRGRTDGLRLVEADEFNCMGIYSDDPNGYCGELRFARSGIELIGATRTPSLRNLENTAPYQHRGQLATLGEVLVQYNEAPDAMIGHNEAKPLNLNAKQLRQLEAFLNTLDAPLATPEEWLSPGTFTLDVSANRKEEQHEAH